MALGLGSLFGKSKPITKEVTPGTGGLRDLYLKHIEETAAMGKPTLTWEDFVKQQQTGPSAGGMRLLPTR